MSETTIQDRFEQHKDTCVLITEAAQILGISRGTVYRWIAEGTLTRTGVDGDGNACVTVGDLVAYARGELRKFRALLDEVEEMLPEDDSGQEE